MTETPRHDLVFRKSMEYPLVAQDFLSAHLPEEILKKVDLKTLVLQKESFVEESLKNSIADVLFSVNMEGEEGYIYLLLEHQSTPDPNMAFRLFEYMLNICRRHRRLNPKEKKYPIVFPLVFYNGEQTYTAERNFWNLFKSATLAKEIWTGDYRLIDVVRISDEVLKGHPWAGILEFFMKHIHERELLQRWQEFAYRLLDLMEARFGEEYIKTLLYYTLPKIDENDRLKLGKLLSKHLEEEEGTRLMTSLAEMWKQEGKHLGIVEGKHLGMVEGKHLGRVEGIQIGEAKLVKGMWENGISLEDISKMTKLSLARVQELINLPLKN